MSVMEGPLSKWTNVMKGWQYRWFVLDDNAGLLSYYTSKEKMVRGARRGCVRLKGAVIGIDDEDDSTFTVTVDGKIFHFQARDAEERERWVRALEDTILRHTHNRLNKRWDSINPLVSIQDFDRKLTESDAYLQLLIDQVKDLEDRCEKITDEKEKGQVFAIKEKANAMVESIKHSIVLLQIAKNTTYPLNGVFQPSKENEDYSLNKQLSVKEMNSGNTSSLLSQPNSRGMGTNSQLLIDEAIDAGKEMIAPASEESTVTVTAVSPSSSLSSLQSACSSAVTNQSATGVPSVETGISALPKSSTSAHLNLVVPETSYSSSDDDDFYDATDDAVMSVQSPVVQRVSQDAEHFESEQPALTPAIKMNNKFDLDALYEEDEEDDLGSLEGQGSVISHLLSQVKIGMDLTKVVLPTFILERRSLLEMYADFFAHPDLFVSIPDYPDPQDRMVQVVKWYLSAFHAGRKSSVAKKPYNPILGEIFKCCWDVPGLEPSREKVENGPVPWADKENLTFIAEQVSHHPPISAFYAEHFNKGITCCAHIWTKSKFLGLSIGVQNIGQGCISLLQYDEEYIINFPSGYGRSILTVPWIELGGQVQITCAKTGYHANIEFLTKPFYGGKKHRVTADVFQPLEKKPFLTVAGEWNGVINAKWANGKTELFVDTQAIQIIRKNVKKIVDQEHFESRRLWKDVTAALKVRNVEVATKAKYVLEQRQREEARERREKNLKWENRVFHEIGEQWIYDMPLQKRLAKGPKES